METKFVKTELSQDEESTSIKKLNELLPIAASYYIKFSDGKIFNKHPELKDYELPKVFHGDLCLDDFFISLKEDCRNIRSMTRVAIPLVWNDKLEREFRAAKVCILCQNLKVKFKENDLNLRKVRHHHHLTGEVSSDIV